MSIYKALYLNPRPGQDLEDLRISSGILLTSVLSPLQAAQVNFNTEYGQLKIDHPDVMVLARIINAVSGAMATMQEVPQEETSASGLTSDEKRWAVMINSWQDPQTEIDKARQHLTKIYGAETMTQVTFTSNKRHGLFEPGFWINHPDLATGHNMAWMLQARSPFRTNL